MPHAMRLLLTLLLFSLCALPTLAKPVLTPAEAPLRFFKALEAMDFAEAWLSLSAESQQQMITKILSTEKDPKLTAESVRQLFERNDRSLQLGFWAGLRYHIGVSDWLKQKFELDKTLSDSEARLLALPARVPLRVKNEKGEWKFGFSESFMPAKPTTVKP